MKQLFCSKKQKLEYNFHQYTKVVDTTKPDYRNLFYIHCSLG